MKIINFRSTEDQASYAVPNTKREESDSSVVDPETDGMSTQCWRIKQLTSIWVLAIVSATLFVCVKISDFSAQGWNF